MRHNVLVHLQSDLKCINTGREYNVFGKGVLRCNYAVAENEVSSIDPCFAGALFKGMPVQSWLIRLGKEIDGGKATMQIIPNTEDQSGETCETRINENLRTNQLLHLREAVDADHVKTRGRRTATDESGGKCEARPNKSLRAKQLLNLSTPADAEGLWARASELHETGADVLLTYPTETKYTAEANGGRRTEAERRSMYTEEPPFNEDVQRYIVPAAQTIRTVSLATDAVKEALRQLQPTKSPGPDGLSAKLLKELAEQLTSQLSKIFESSMEKEALPTDWKLTNIIPIYKGRETT
ncbi:unnamed protein product [Dibothriocephalus latus]|uniref:Reverse transcriptase domain-containing protein n=1 Tax=Dibothriocephalus latus TaxID=60516 RepID=A0A3P7NZD5_DIBLA|nr:unnamed protein product [Dibothriocephalus latus]